jgi:hypothetical protein
VLVRRFVADRHRILSKRRRIHVGVAADASGVSIGKTNRWMLVDAWVEYHLASYALFRVEAKSVKTRSCGNSCSVKRIEVMPLV